MAQNKLKNSVANSIRVARWILLKPAGTGTGTGTETETETRTITERMPHPLNNLGLSARSNKICYIDDLYQQFPVGTRMLVLSSFQVLKLV